MTRPDGQVPASVCFDDRDSESPVMWVDEYRLAVNRARILQGSVVAARLTIAKAVALVIPVRAEIPTAHGQTFQILDMPPRTLRIFRAMFKLAAPAKHGGRANVA